MNLTRARVETTMLQRLGRYMTAAQFVLAPVGNLDALNDPLATALAQVRLGVADPLAPTDADLHPLPPARESELLDRVELRLLRNILGNLPDTDYSHGGKTESKNQLPERVRQMALDKEKNIALLYGDPVTDAPAAGSTGLKGGIVRVKFQDDYDDWINP